MKTATPITAAMLAVALMGPALAGCAQAVRVRIDDATITTRVKTALLNDPEIGARGIDVATVNGRVTLSGTVRSQEEVERAVHITSGVDGVVDVQVRLAIEPGG